MASSDGNLYALNREGVLLWKFSTNSPLVSAPAIGSDGTIYLGSCLRCPFPSPSGPPEGILYAINPGGTLKWNITITSSGEGIDRLTSPTIGPDGTIYVSDVGFRIIAANPDGGLKWAVRAFGEVVDPPALGKDGTVYVGVDDPGPTGACGQCLMALNPDGTVKWGAVPEHVGFSSPTVGSDGTVYIDGFAMNPDGSVKWQNTGKFLSPSIGPDGAIYGVMNGGVYSLNPDGTFRWHFLAQTVQQSSAAVGSDGTIFFGDWSGTLYAVSASGTLAWKFAIGSRTGSTVSDPAIGSDGTVYVGSSDGKLYAISQV